jgi:hypothetical protein
LRMPEHLIDRRQRSEGGRPVRHVLRSWRDSRRYSTTRRTTVV